MLDFNVKDVGIAAIIFAVSVVMMFWVQAPTSEYLNPGGLCFGVIAIFSGIYMVMGGLCILTDNFG